MSDPSMTAALTAIAGGVPDWLARAGLMTLTPAAGLLGALAALRLAGLLPVGGGGGGAARDEAAMSFGLGEGVLQPRGRAARRFLGAERAARGLALRARVLEGPGDLEGALATLEAAGAGFEALVEIDGAAWRATGALAHGAPRLTLARAAPERVEAARLRAELATERAARRAAEATLDAAPALIWRRDAAGRLSWANARFRAVAGGGAGEGAPPAELRLDAAAEAPGPEPVRRAVFHAEDGRRLWHDLSERPAPPEAGLAPGARLGFGIDAAAAVHAEAALRRFVETLTETFAHLRVGLAVFDRNQRLGLFNPAFAELMRLEPAWLAGRPGFGEVLARLRDNRMAPEREDFTLWRREMSELFGDGPARDGGDQIELWELPGELTIRVLARPHPQGAVALLFEDVSETARLERAWSVETETRRAVMDRLTEGVAAFGPNGEARFANPAFARIWGFRPGREGERLRFEEALARFRAAAAPSPAWARLRAFFEEPERRTPWSEEVALRDGRRLRARIAALPDGSVLTAFHDVTDSHRAEAALRDRNAALAEAEAIRGALIEQISDRLEAPLATVTALARMLRGAEPREGTRAARLGAIQSAAEEIREVLAGVADLAAAQTGAAGEAGGLVDLGAALAAAVRQAGRAAQRRGVVLAAAPPEGPPGALVAAADAARARQLLFNLIAEAVERAPPGAAVRAGVRRRDARVEVWAEEPAGAAGEDFAPRLAGGTDVAARAAGFAEAAEAGPGPRGGAPRAAGGLAGGAEARALGVGSDARGLGVGSDAGGLGVGSDAGAGGPAPRLAAGRRGLAHALVRRFAEMHGGALRVERAGPWSGGEETDAPLLPFDRPPPGAPRLRVVCALPAAEPVEEAAEHPGPSAPSAAAPSESEPV